MQTHSPEIVAAAAPIVSAILARMSGDNGAYSPGLAIASYGPPSLPQSLHAEVRRQLQPHLIGGRR